MTWTLMHNLHFRRALLDSRANWTGDILLPQKKICATSTCHIWLSNARKEQAKRSTDHWQVLRKSKETSEYITCWNIIGMAEKWYHILKELSFSCQVNCVSFRNYKIDLQTKWFVMCPQKSKKIGNFFVCAEFFRWCKTAANLTPPWKLRTSWIPMKAFLWCPFTEKLPGGFPSTV